MLNHLNNLTKIFFGYLNNINNKDYVQLFK